MGGGMTTPVTDQEAFQGRDDSQALNSSTFTHTLNTGWTQDADTTFRIRFEIQETAGGTTGNVQYTLEYNYNGIGWVDVTLSTLNAVYITTSGQYADQDTATQVIGDGSYVNGSGVEDPSTSTGNINLTSESSESEWALRINSALVVGGNTVDIRVKGLDGYTNTPTITINIAGTDYVRVEDETEGISETTVRALDANRLTNETEGISEALNTLKSMPRAQDETEGITETTLALLNFLRSVDDTEGIVEATARILGSIRAADDTEGITEGVIRALAAIRSVDSTEGIVEATIRALAANRVADDTVGIVDTVLALLFLIKVHDETVGISETTLRILTSLRSADDTVGISEVLASTLDAIRVQDSTEGIIESVLATIIAFRVHNETVGIDESVTLGRAHVAPAERQNIIDRVIAVFVLDKGGLGGGKAPGTPEVEETYNAFVHGGFQFEESYVDDLTGFPLRRREARRDYLDRLVMKDPDERTDRDELLKYFVHRPERPDDDP